MMTKNLYLYDKFSVSNRAVNAPKCPWFKTILNSSQTTPNKFQEIREGFFDPEIGQFEILKL